MARQSAIVSVIFSANSRKYQRALKENATRMQKFEFYTNKSLKSIGRGFTQLGIAAAAVAPLVKGALESVEAYGIAQTVLGDKTLAELDRIRAKSAETLALTKTDVDKFATAINTQLGAIGVGDADIAKNLEPALIAIQDLTRLQANLGKAGGRGQAARAFTEAIQGEFSQLQDVIGTIDDDTQQWIKTLSGAERIEAVLGLVEGSAAAGSFAAYMETAAGEIAVTQAKLSNMSDDIGEKLIPILQKVVGVLDFMTRNWQLLGVVLGLAVLPKVLGLTKGIKDMTKAMKVLNVVSRLGPIGLILGLGSLVIAGVAAGNSGNSGGGGNRGNSGGRSDTPTKNETTTSPNTVAANNAWSFDTSGITGF